ncbi:MAG: serine/threonine-protein phosphatase [Ruminococcus sp.]|nr:serine/threonine-protein phosphatase [Ruminococcus sp.]
MSEKPGKKNQKLLIQIGLILLPVFTVLIIAVSWMMYNSTVNGFLEAQRTNMETSLEETVSSSFRYLFTDDEELRWFLDKWEQEPSAILRETDPEAAERYQEYFDSFSDTASNDEGSGSNKEFVEGLPDDLLVYYLKTRYDLIQLRFGDDVSANRYDSLFLLDVSDENRGFVICECSKDGTSKELGSRFDIDLSKHPAIQKLIDAPGDRAEFEKSEDLPGPGDYYIAYMPVVLDGKTRAVIGIVYNWADLRETMNSSMLKAQLLGIGGLSLAMAILLIVLYRRSIRPLTKIQSIVCDYTESKNSADVISRMSEIKEHNEFGLLSDNISELAKAIDQYTGEITELTGERERAAAELDMARTIQAGQLPNKFPAFPDRTDFDIYASMTPAREVGGDFYDYLLIDDDHLAIVIADVSDKGVPAALFMMMSKILIRTFTSMGLSPGEVLNRTNETIAGNNKERMFVTVWLGILEISTGKVTAANAGHEYPMIRQPGGSFELFKDKHGMVVGGLKKAKYSQYEFTLQKGGTLFLYTDGVPEAHKDPEDMFGFDRLLDALDQTPDAPPKELLENVRSVVDRFVGDAPQFDDLTMVAVKLN